jgi:hypothetical protein
MVGGAGAAAGAASWAESSVDIPATERVATNTAGRTALVNALTAAPAFQQIGMGWNARWTQPWTDRIVY